MSEREMYLAMAGWFRLHGFSPEFGRVGSGACGCFLRAFEELDHPDITFLADIVGGLSLMMDADRLRNAGWIEGSTDDAIAACEIAADLAAY